jgi:hypothetical protein
VPVRLPQVQNSNSIMLVFNSAGQCLSLRFRNRWKELCSYKRTPGLNPTTCAFASNFGSLVLVGQGFQFWNGQSPGLARNSTCRLTAAATLKFISLSKMCTTTRSTSASRSHMEERILWS